MPDIHSQVCRHVGCELRVPAGLEQEALCINHYLEMAFHNLRDVTESIRRKQAAERITLEWLFAQVDFAVNSLAVNTGILDTNQRTALLELLLGLVNLNEYMRDKMVPILRSA